MGEETALTDFHSGIISKEFGHFGENARWGEWGLECSQPPEGQPSLLYSCWPSYSSSMSQSRGFSVISIHKNLLVSELSLLGRVFLFLEVLFACILSFLTIFIYVEREVPLLLWFSWEQRQGVLSLQYTPGPSPRLGIQSHLRDCWIGGDHLGCSAHLCPFSSWEQVSRGWGALCNSEQTSCPVTWPVLPMTRWVAST